jgi:hypothetical protein
MCLRRLLFGDKEGSHSTLGFRIDFEMPNVL